MEEKSKKFSFILVFPFSFFPLCPFFFWEMNGGLELVMFSSLFGCS